MSRVCAGGCYWIGNTVLVHVATCTCDEETDAARDLL